MIRVAIVGAGIGKAHLAGYKALPENYDVRTICDLDAARAKSLIDGDAIAVETDFSQVLDNPQIDLVDICLPPHLHFSACKTAMEAGKHVVCEKPLVPSLKEADALLRIAEVTGRVLTPVFQYRYGLAMAQLNALRQADLLGKPYAASLETHWNRDAAYYAVDWRGTWIGENGGAVLGHAIHNHDLVTTVLGPIARLSAALGTRVNDIEVEDCASISLVMESGALVTSSITLGCADDITRLRFCFDGLTAESGTSPYAPMTGNWRFTAREPVRQVQVDEVLADVPAGHAGFAGFFEDLAVRLETGGGNPVSMQAGRRSIELVTAIYHADRTGSWVSLPLGDDTPLYAGWVP
jgi:predicted dehydrogenase